MQWIHLRPVWTLSQPSDYHFILTFQFCKYSICVIDLFSGDSFKADCTILHNDVVQFFKAGCTTLHTTAGSRKGDIDNGQTAHSLAQPARRQDCFPNSSEFKPSL